MIVFGGSRQHGNPHCYVVSPSQHTPLHVGAVPVHVFVTPTWQVMVASAPWYPGMHPYITVVPLALPAAQALSGTHATPLGRGKSSDGAFEQKAVDGFMNSMANATCTI